MKKFLIIAMATISPFGIHAQTLKTIENTPGCNSYIRADSFYKAHPDVIERICYYDGGRGLCDKEGELEMTKKWCDQAMLPGVKLGMTAKTVREETNWGIPKAINRSVGKWGVHEQWVYDGGYLYFENGKLTSYQN